MNRALELFESRVDRISTDEDTVRVHFSHGYVHQSRGEPGSDPGTAWSQELAIVLHQARVDGAAAGLADEVVGGWLETGGTRYELIPLPFGVAGGATLRLELRGGGTVRVSGRDVVIQLLDAPIFLEKLP